MADWKFYGRKEQLAELERMLDRKRWFFAKVTGRASHRQDDPDPTCHAGTQQQATGLLCPDP